MLCIGLVDYRKNKVQNAFGRYRSRTNAGCIFYRRSVPFPFFLERELAKWQEMGMSREEINEYVKYFTGTFAVIGIVSAIVFGIAGVYIGKLILKRHFKDME